MDKLNNLIQKYCPEGVEYRNLGEIAQIATGKGITKKDCIENGKYPIISGGITPMGKYNLFNRNENTVTISRVGINAGFVNYINEKFYLNDKCFSIMPKYKQINNKYMYYFLKKNEKEINDLQSKSGVPTINTKKLSCIKIPIPPIRVQEEIVRILDSFTKLNEKLNEELIKRKKQYEYYRDKLLSFDKNDTNVKWMKLGEVSYIPKERTSSENISLYISVENMLKDKGGIIKSNNKPKCGNTIKFNKEDILIGNIRPYLKKIWYADCNGGTNSDVVLIRNNDPNVLLSRYMYYQLASDIFFNYNNSFAKGGKMPRGDKKKIMEYFFPIPPLETQQRIVSILDCFEQLCNNLTVGLPSEIEARQKQYEYYRDKLLTFKELKQ